MNLSQTLISTHSNSLKELESKLNKLGLPEEETKIILIKR